MAEIVEQLPFGWNNSSNDLGYNWAQWLDGQVWKLVQGVDFHEDARAFQRRAYNAAKTAPAIDRDGVAYRVARVRTKNRSEGEPDAPLVVFYLQAELVPAQ